MKNHYQTLGLNTNATQDEIKKAYRKLAIKFHPDKNVGDNFFDELFRGIKDAYDILSNLVSKRDYDLKYNAFVNKANGNTYATSQQRSTKKQKQAYRSKSKISYFDLKKTILENIVAFNKKTLISKLRLLFNIILLGPPLIGIYLKGFLGFIIIIGFYVFANIFIHTLRNKNKTNNIGGLVGAPIIALIIFGQGLDFFETDPFESFDTSDEIEEIYVPSTYYKGVSEAHNKIREKEAEFKKKISDDKFIKKPSKYKGNQLKNGTSPFDAYFGKGVYSQNAWIKFINSNKSDAVVCLVQSSNQKTIRNEYIRAGAIFEMSKIPSGTYYMKVYYGNDWNPNKKNFCGINGAFERNVSFSKSDKIGDRIKIENTSRSYTTGTITLYAVENGNMTTEMIDEEDFFK